MNLLSRIRYIIRYLIFIRHIRKAGRFSHSPFTKSSMLYLLSVATYIYSPAKIVQLGVGEGVSCIVMLLMAKLRGIKNVSVLGYDNFAFRSVGEAVSKAVFWNNLRKYKVDSFVTMLESNVLEVQCPYTNIDMLNIDIDNTHDKLLRLYELGWFDCVSENGLIVMEGGFSSHQNLDNSRGINRACMFLQERGFQTFTFRKYPGLVFVRKQTASDAKY